MRLFLFQILSSTHTVKESAYSSEKPVTPGLLSEETSRNLIAAAKPHWNHVQKDVMTLLQKNAGKQIRQGMALVSALYGFKMNKVQ